MLRKTLAVVALLLTIAFGANAQRVGIKTNLLTDVTLNPNLGIEFGLAKHWTLEADYEINAWNIHEHKLKHYVVSPEVRWWFCERWQGSFWGLHLLGGQYNIGNIPGAFNFLGQEISKLREHRYEGWYLGAGLGYGYAWALSKHWNLEFEVGVGYAFMKYDEYPACVECGVATQKDAKHNYFGLTKLALSLEYLF